MIKQPQRLFDVHIYSVLSMLAGISMFINIVVPAAAPLSSVTRGAHSGRYGTLPSRRWEWADGTVYAHRDDGTGLR
jgi:hypothetical protein